MDRVVG